MIFFNNFTFGIIYTNMIFLNNFTFNALFKLFKKKNFNNNQFRLIGSKSESVKKGSKLSESVIGRKMTSGYALPIIIETIVY